MSQRSLVEIDTAPDDQTVRALLEVDRRWSAYALCDLDRPFRDHARFIAAMRASAVSALALVYAPPDFTAVLTYGDVSGVGTIIRHASDLPDKALVIALPEHMPAVEAHYRFEKKWIMYRMATDIERIQPAESTDKLIRLSSADLPAVLDLYHLWPETVFTPSMLAFGIYYGAYRDERLVAIAGTHALSTRHCVGAIGNVFTHPEYRGHGLATAVTGAVTQELFRVGVRDVVLNVHVENVPAIAAYRRLGFSVHLDFVEGPATLH